MGTEPFTAKDISDFNKVESGLPSKIADDPVNTFHRFLDTINDLMTQNHELFKDVLIKKKQLGEYHELCMSDVKHKERIKELEVKLAHSLELKQEGV